MVTANWQLTVAGSRAEVLELLADYSRGAEWTPAVRTASKTTPGPIRVGTVFEQTIDICGRATPIKWKVKTLMPTHEVTLKGSMKVDPNVWWWPAKAKIKVLDKYYVQEGPNEGTTVVEYYGHTKANNLSKLILPRIKREWRDIKAAAREGLARVRGRPAEKTPTVEVSGQAVPARALRE